jgi:hypothetical protein
MAKGPYLGMDYQSFRKLLQGIMVVGGMFLMFPGMRSISDYPIYEFITPAFIIGGVTVFYAIQAFRGKI